MLLPDIWSDTHSHIKRAMIGYIPQGAPRHLALVYFF